MAPSLLACLTGAFLLVSARGQGQNKNNCNFDPDIIFFEDDDLEKLKNSFRVNGACSPAVWKNEFNNHLRNELDGGKLKPLSLKDRTTLNGLKVQQRTPNKQQRPPFIHRQPQFQRPRDTHSGSYSHRGPRNLPFRDIREHESQKQGFHNNFLSEESVTRHIPQSPDHFTYYHSRGPLSSEAFFKPGNKRFERMPQDEGDFSSGNRRRSQNQRRQDVFFGNNNGRNPPNNLLPINDQRRRSGNVFGDNNARRPNNQPTFLPSNDQRRPQNQGRPEDFFGGNNGRRIPQTQGSFLSSDDTSRPQNQERPGEFFVEGNGGNSNNQGTFIPPRNQRRPQSEEFPRGFSDSDGSRPQNQGTFLPSDDQRRPQSQGRPEDYFGPNNQREGQNQGTSNDFFRPDGQRRPQQFDGNQNIFDNQRPNQIPQPQTTTQRPQTTTLPGPPTWATPASPCVRQCPNTPEYNPVCGTDRVTYRNPGRLRCEKRCGKASVVVNHYGNCIATTARPTPTTPTSLSSRRTTSTTPPTFSRNMG